MNDDHPQSSLRMPLLVLAALLAALAVAVALLREPPRPAAPIAADTAVIDSAPHAPAPDDSAARDDPTPPTPDRGESEMRAAAQRAAHAMVVRYIASGLLLEADGLFPWPDLARRAFGGELTEVAEQLAARGADGEREADTALLALDDYLCAHMRRIDSAETLRERMRSGQEQARSATPLSADEERYFADVFDAEVRVIDELHARCALLDESVRMALERLQGAAAEDDPDALVYLTHAGLAERDTLLPVLGDLPQRLLPTAVRTILDEHAPDLCANKDLLLETVLVRGFDSPALASVTAQVLQLDCSESPANASLAMPFLRSAALAGELQAIGDYGEQYANRHPDDGRIERFAWRLYRQRLNGYGCLGSGYLYYLRDTLSDPQEQGRDLSPYEYSTAIERADAMWAEHGDSARQRLGCNAPQPGVGATSGAIGAAVVAAEDAPASNK